MNAVCLDFWDLLHNDLTPLGLSNKLNDKRRCQRLSLQIIQKEIIDQSILLGIELHDSKSHPQVSPYLENVIQQQADKAYLLSIFIWNRNLLSIFIWNRNLLSIFIWNRNLPSIFIWNRNLLSIFIWNRNLLS